MIGSLQAGKMKVEVQSRHFLCHLMVSICLLLSHIEPCHSSAAGHLNRSSFPSGFIFGAGSSAYQYEGAAYIDGRKASIWDTFTKNQPEKILDHSNGNMANNFYYRYETDIALMKEIGLDSFRFSISWSRIFPQGKISRGVNQEGVDFYNYLINQLISNGIKPFVTLFHFDLPQTLEDEYGGFLSPNVVILHPITYGSYPKIMRSMVGDRLPKFTKSESETVRGSIDFLGVNYYTSCYADDLKSYSTVNLSYSTDSHVNLTLEKNGIPIGESTGSSWLYIYPKGIREMLLYIKRKYNPPPIYITENGMGDVNSGSWPINKGVNDGLRIKYHSLHLSYLLEAIKEGVDVRGYYIWSFLDNFEWESGYTLRYGITFVDYKDKLNRHLKKSAFWFKSFLQKENTTIQPSLLYSQ